MTKHEPSETFGAGKSKIPGSSWILLDQLTDPPRRALARDNNQIKLAVDRKRQHTGSGRFDQTLIIEWASFARYAVKRLKDGAERSGVGAQKSFLAHFAGSDQHAIRADLKRSRSILGGFDHVGGKQRPDAVDLWAVDCACAAVVRRPRIDRWVVGALIKPFCRATGGLSGPNCYLHTPPPRSFARFYLSCNLNASLGCRPSRSILWALLTKTMAAAGRRC